jgi:hypothetical protein
MPIHTRSLCSQIMAVTCSVLLISGSVPPPAQARSGQQAAAPDEAAPKIPNDQLDSLVAPIALYPDPLLAQVLAASTYPLEVIQLQQWLTKNKGLSDKALADAVMKEDWDPSVQALAALPDVAKRLADDIKWTTDLGNAFLVQQSDVMDAVQRMRAKAKDTGNLKPSEQQKVETKVIENKTVIIIEQANPQVVYVPTYNPVVVYGPPIYPYPPIYYPPPGYYAAGMAISFGVGIAVGAAWGGGWGYYPRWGGGYKSNNNITINNNNNFINNSNKQNINNNRQNVNNASGNRTGGNNNWQHNAQHRGGAPYSNRATANQYGGTARGDSMSTRQANARQTQAQAGSRQQAGGTRPNQGQAGARPQPTAGNLSAGNASANRANAGTGAANRGTGSGGASAGTNRTGASGGAGGGDRVGNRSVSPSTTASSRGSALSGASGGAGGSATRASSSRGASSMGASRSGGGGPRR